MNARNEGCGVRVEMEERLWRLPACASMPVDGTELRRLAGEEDVRMDLALQRVLEDAVHWWPQAQSDFRVVYWVVLAGHRRALGATTALVALLQQRLPFGGRELEDAVVKMGAVGRWMAMRALVGVDGSTAPQVVRRLVRVVAACVEQQALGAGEWEGVAAVLRRCVGVVDEDALGEVVLALCRIGDVEGWRSVRAMGESVLPVSYGLDCAALEAIARGEESWYDDVGMLDLVEWYAGDGDPSSPSF